MKWHKGILSWFEGKKLFLSVPFTWLLKEAEYLVKNWPGEVYAGGPAISLMKPIWAKPADVGEVVQRHNPDATFTTRGCPFSCEFCAVPKIEGRFVELKKWRPAPIVCDNNILASSRKHFIQVIDSLLSFRGLDFNQGLDARLLKPWHIDQFGRLKSMMARFAFDEAEDEGRIKNAIDSLISSGFGKRRIRIYCLIGYKESPEEAIYRLEKVRSWGIKPNPMRYQPLDAIVKNSHVPSGWTERKLRDVMQYYSRLVWRGSVPFSEFSQMGRRLENHQNIPSLEVNKDELLGEQSRTL